MPMVIFDLDRNRWFFTDLKQGIKTMKFNFFSQHNPEILAQLMGQKNLPLVDGDLNVEEHHQNNVNSNYLLITNHGKIDGYIEAELALMRMEINRK